MSTQRAMPGGRVDRANLRKGPNGRYLCRWCDIEVPPGRLTFCSDWCVEEWRLRSDPGHLRERVLERDRGICAICGLDCIAELRRVKKLQGSARAKARIDWHLGKRKRSGTPITSCPWLKAAANATFLICARSALNAIASALSNCASVCLTSRNKLYRFRLFCDPNGYGKTSGWPHRNNGPVFD